MGNSYSDLSNPICQNIKPGGNNIGPCHPLVLYFGIWDLIGHYIGTI
jgi:hypothetical protein